jgi:LacI family transcriptional regulator
MDIREIAKRARVSTATVSRVVNRIPTVNPQMAKRVWSVIEELGYYPNTQARALVSGRSRIFGLIISDITNPFFPEGVAILTFGMEEPLLEHLHVRKVPIVFVDVGPQRPWVSNIRIDYLHGIRQAVQHLAALRHERIAFISGPLKLKSSFARQQAFIRSTREIGIEADSSLMVEGDHTMEGGMSAFAKLLARPARPTAVVCSNDMTAIGVMRKSHEAHISIPQDLSVIGFDDIRLAQFMIPPLTTIQMSQAELARLAFNALMADVDRETPDPNGTEYELKTNLVLRESTRLNAPASSARR